MREGAKPATPQASTWFDLFRNWAGLDTANWSSEFVLAGAVLLAPLAAGTVHTPTTVLLLVLCLVAFWLRALGSFGKIPWRGWRDPLGLVVLGVLAWQVFTLIPLGPRAIGALSPNLAANLDFGELEGVARWTLTYAPGATAWEVLKLAGAAAALLLSLQICRTSRGRRRVIIISTASLAVFLVLTVLQSLSGTESILWYYRPSAYTGLGTTSLVDLCTTFVNANHAAQFVELTGLGALAYGALSVGRYRFVFVALGIVSLIVIVLTGSGAGILVTAMSCGFIATLTIARRWRRLSPLRWVVPGVAVAGAIVGLILLAWSPSPGPEDDPRPEWIASKVRAWPSTTTMIGEHLWVGIGRGGYRDAFPQFQEPGLANSFTFVENEALQLWSELGVPVGSVLMLAVVLTWFVSLARWRGRSSHAATLAGTFAVGTHSFVDFGLEFGGVGLPFVVLLGAVAAAARGKRRVGRTSGWLPLVASLVLTASLVLAPRTLAHGEYTDVMRHILEAGRAGGDEATIRDALAQRPNSPDVALAIAAYHEISGDPFANLRWLSRAMALAPQDAPPHTLAARTLADLGKERQAMLELKTALQLSPLGHGKCYIVLANLARDTGDIEYVFEDDQAGKARFATYLFTHRRGGDLAHAVVADLEGDGSAIATARAEAAMNSGDPAAAEQALRAFLALEPDDLAATISLAHTLVAQGRADEGRDRLTELSWTSTDDATILLEMARISRETGETKQARRDIRRARLALDTTNLRLVADIEVMEGNLCRDAKEYPCARDRYMRALQVYPEWHHVRTRLGLVYRDMGDPDAALRELRRVRRDLGPREDLDDWIEGLEAGEGP